MIATVLCKSAACVFNEFFMYLISIYTSAFWCTKTSISGRSKGSTEFFLRIHTLKNFNQLSSWLKNKGHHLGQKLPGLFHVFPI